MTDISKLLSLFDKFSYSKTASTAFIELLDMILIPFKVYDTKDEAEAHLARVTTHPHKDVFVSIATHLGELSEGFRDPLGELYMQRVTSSDLGQYFTPEHVCALLAQLAFITDDNGKTILDPACGSGRMLLAAANINRHLLFHGADLDTVCCKIALVNMLLQSLTGEIAHMDSLSNEFFTGYHVNTTLCNGYYSPWYREFANPEESAIWLRPKKKSEIVFPVKTAGAYQQGTLF